MPADGSRAEGCIGQDFRAAHGVAHEEERRAAGDVCGEDGGEVGEDEGGRAGETFLGRLFDGAAPAAGGRGTGVRFVRRYGACASGKLGWREEGVSTSKGRTWTYRWSKAKTSMPWFARSGYRGPYKLPIV